jgi:hypothetical protein
MFLPLLLLSEIILDLKFSAGKLIRNITRAAFGTGLILLFFIRIFAA